MLPTSIFPRKKLEKPSDSNDKLYQYTLRFRTQILMYEAKVKIQLKKGISDPEGANTLKALHLLGFKTVQEAKAIRTVELLIDGKNKDEVKKQVEQMCQRLLTNPVIHTYKIDIKEK
jgi:phosphoribosylformylglycinamidine synthase PurS subunit